MKTINFFAKSILSVAVLISVYSCEKEDLSSLDQEVNSIENGITQKSNRVVLTKDTSLNPSGSGKAVWFKGGTTIVYDAQGKVKTGTLRDNTSLNPSGSGKAVWFKANTQITFAYGQNGKVKKGTIRDRSYLRILGSSSSQWIPAGTIVTFYDIWMSV